MRLSFLVLLGKSRRILSFLDTGEEGRSASCFSTSLSYQDFTLASDSQVLLIKRTIEVQLKTKFCGISRSQIRWDIKLH